MNALMMINEFNTNHLNLKRNLNNHKLLFIFVFKGFRMKGFWGFGVLGFWVLGFGFWVLGLGSVHAVSVCSENHQKH